MKRKLQLSIVTLVAFIASILGGTALAQTPPSSPAASTTTVAKPSMPALLSTDAPSRPADCTKAATMAAYAAKLDALRKEALALRDDDAIAKAYGTDIDKYVDKIRRAQLALPSWCKGAGVPTTTTIAAKRPAVLDDNLTSEPDSCDNPAEINAWNSQQTAYLARLDAVDTAANQQWASEIKEKRDNATEMRDSLVALCNEKNPSTVTTVKAQAKNKSASNKRSSRRTAPPATAAPRRSIRISKATCQCEEVTVDMS